jgi:branched-chain amino acid transport system substrate-binding protein
MFNRQSCFVLSILLTIAFLTMPVIVTAQDKQVKIGILNPNTGPLAKIGATNRQAFEMAIEDVNAAGGIKALGGAKITVAWGDTQTKPAVGAAETERLIEREGVPIIVANYSSSVMIAASAVAEKLKTPYLNYISVADIITQRGFKYVFRINAPASQWSRAQLQYLADLRKAGAKIETIALFYEDTDWGQATSNAHRKYAQEFGLKIVADEPYPANATDLTVKLLKLKQANPDVLIPSCFIADGILIAKTRERIGWNNVFVCHGGSGALEPEYLALGKAVEGEVTVNHFNYNIHEYARKINERFKAKYGVEMNGNAAIAYQAIIVVAEALEIAKSTEREAVRDAMTKVNLKPGPTIILPYKGLKFDSTGQNDEAQLLITQMIDGKFVTVWPEQFATAKTKFSK